jgi:hypothetical protein
MDIVQTILNYGQFWIRVANVANLTPLSFLSFLFLLLLEIVVALPYSISFLIVDTSEMKID